MTKMIFILIFAVSGSVFAQNPMGGNEKIPVRATSDHGADPLKDKKASSKSRPAATPPMKEGYHDLELPDLRGVDPDAASSKSNVRFKAEAACTTAEGRVLKQGDPGYLHCVQQHGSSGINGVDTYHSLSH